jgi:hypothetical protein
LIKGTSRVECRVIVVKAEGNNPRGRHRCRWDNSIRMDRTEIGYYGLNWIELAQIKNTFLALLKKIINIPVP